MSENLKYRAVTEFYGIAQVSPWFATPAEASQWCKEHQVEYDFIQPVGNWREVGRWQADPAYPAHYCGGGPWPVLS